MIAFAAGLFVFLAIVAGAAALLARNSDSEAGERRLRKLRQAPAVERAGGMTLRKPHPSSALFSRWLRTGDKATDLPLKLQRAGLQLRVGEFILLRCLLALVSGSLPVLLIGPNTPGLVVGLACGIVGYLLPPLYLGWATQRRVARIERQLLDLVPGLSSSLRSGFGFQQAVDVAARQVGPPLFDELTTLLNDVKLGATMEAALQDFARRVGSADLDMIVTAILVQRTTGGNLAEVLDQVGRTMGEREKVRADVMTLTASQRMTGMILSVYPVLVGLMLLAIMPSLWSKLFTEPAGQALLAVAMGLQLVGFVFIRRALRVDY